MVSKSLCTFTVQKMGQFIPTFNLPRNDTICIGATPACKEYCYARRHHFNMENVKKKFESNYQRSLQPEFREIMTTELRCYVNQGVTRMRLHSSGDFYSQDYLDSWKRIARAVPDITYVGYTRSYQLDFKRLPSNLKIFYSIDDTTTEFNKQLKRWAMVMRKKEHFKGDIPGSFICKSSCYKCKACFVDGVKDVIFIKH